MKLNTIHQDLKGLYKKEKEVFDVLGFTFTAEDEISRIIDLFKKGYWSVLPFAFGTYNNFAVKMHPKNSIEASSIVQINNSDGVTVAANLKTFLPLVSLKYLDEIKIIQEDYVSGKKLFESISLLYREYTNGVDVLNFFYKYITNSDNLKRIEKQDEGYHKKTYLDFWNHYNNTSQQKRYSDLITQLNTDENFYPEYKIVDYGLWNTRAYNALAKRAYMDYDAEFKKTEMYIWSNLIQAHGFDGLSGGFGIIPNPSSDSSTSILKYVKMFSPDLGNSFSKEVLEHPLYEAIQDLRIRQRSYMGEKHIEAAAILDTEHNDPYASWDALVTASYWAGQAGSKAIEPMWEAAIYLSEKHNWTEIHEVLVQQYEYYNFYKDKV